MAQRTTLLLFWVVGLGCGAATPEPEEEARPTSRTSETIVEVIREEPPEEVEEPREPMLVKGVTARSGEGENPRIQIVSPRKNATVRRGPAKVKLRVTDWPTSPDGPHVAVLVDDEPPIRVDDPSQAVELVDLEEGSHLVCAAAVMATGESIKGEGGFACTPFHLRRRTPNWGLGRRQAFLTLHLPAGSYEGEAAVAIPLDVQVTGATLGERGHRIKVQVGEAISGEITELVPHFLRDLPDGPNELVVELVDAEGRGVGGPFGRISRTIHVDRSPGVEEVAEDESPSESME